MAMLVITTTNCPFWTLFGLHDNVLNTEKGDFLYFFCYDMGFGLYPKMSHREQVDGLKTGLLDQPGFGCFLVWETFDCQASSLHKDIK
jgi:hypothetical protein